MASLKLPCHNSSCVGSPPKTFNSCRALPLKWPASWITCSSPDHPFCWYALWRLGNQLSSHTSGSSPVKSSTGVAFPFHSLGRVGEAGVPALITYVSGLDKVRDTGTAAVAWAGRRGHCSVCIWQGNLLISSMYVRQHQTATWSQLMCHNWSTLFVLAYNSCLVFSSPL